MARVSELATGNAFYRALVGLHDVYELRLVAEDPATPIDATRWTVIQHLLLDFQPAQEMRLEGDPPSAIWVRAFGGTEVAPALLADVERLAGTALRVDTT